MSKARRLAWVRVLLAACGVCGLITLITLASQRTLARGILAGLLAWQGFWLLLRIFMATGIYRREPELSRGERLFFGASAPFPLLCAVWLGRGKLSYWIATGRIGHGED